MTNQPCITLPAASYAALRCQHAGSLAIAVPAGRVPAVEPVCDTTLRLLAALGAGGLCCKSSVIAACSPPGLTAVVLSWATVVQERNGHHTAGECERLRLLGGGLSEQIQQHDWAGQPCPPGRAVRPGCMVSVPSSGRRSRIRLPPEYQPTTGASTAPRLPYTESVLLRSSKYYFDLGGARRFELRTSCMPRGMLTFITVKMIAGDGPCGSMPPGLCPERRSSHGQKILKQYGIT